MRAVRKLQKYAGLNKHCLHAFRGARMIDISSILGKGAEIVLNAGDSSCRLQLDRRVSVENILQQMSLYSKRVTPIYGAYFLFLLALLFGGTWACCKLRKKRHQDEVPYQELEMGPGICFSYKCCYNRWLGSGLG